MEHLEYLRRGWQIVVSPPEVLGVFLAVSLCDEVRREGRRELRVTRTDDRRISREGILDGEPYRVGCRRDLEAELHHVVDKLIFQRRLEEHRSDVVVRVLGCAPDLSAGLTIEKVEQLRDRRYRAVRLYELFPPVLAKTESLRLLLVVISGHCIEVDVLCLEVE